MVSSTKFLFFIKLYKPWDCWGNPYSFLIMYIYHVIDTRVRALCQNMPGMVTSWMIVFAHYFKIYNRRDTYMNNSLF